MARWNGARSARTTTTGLAAVALAIALAGASCGGAGKQHAPFIPREDTAREQFVIAQQEEKAARGLFDKPQREERLGVAIDAYRKVEDEFPADERYTPAAALVIANLYKELGEMEQAQAQYQYVLKKYPNQEDVRLASLFELGVTLDKLERPEEAQKYYRMVIDEFSGSTNPEFQSLVERARERYRLIR